MKLNPYEILFYAKETMGDENIMVEKKDFLKTVLLERLKKRTLRCRKCPLYKTRKNVVFGDGNPLTGFVLVGEAPGAEEDKQGIPFVGRAGKKLNEILMRAGIRREGVYILNTLKCRPPRNRDPEEKEIKSCFPYFEKQIEILNPKVIVALGRFAAYVLTGRNIAVTKERGLVYEYKKIPVVITLHPSRVLQNPREEELLLKDLKIAKEIYLNGPPESIIRR